MTTHHVAGSAPTTSVRGEVWVGVACVAGGVVLGALWALVGATVVGATDPDEQAAASDGTFALLGIGFGLVSALLLAVLPGHRQVVRAGVALAGSVLGGFVGLAVGLVLGAPALRADGMVLAWPVVLGAVTTLRLLVVHLLGRE
ncbi:hypothetical protein [Kineosporia sp. A_224]|uniref:hypothetical protein n=1 Tax=Kineosporia sp. A_224 TaxID=1962180 RepID=UPI00117ACF42|nr:hypothetical protein [Kineosporia sp. A_224]